jgi:predicted homoserine dehydrogenase-like protein
MWNKERNESMMRTETQKKPLRVSVIGAGYWGKNLVRNFYSLGALDSVCDLSDETLDRAARNTKSPF